MKISILRMAGGGRRVKSEKQKERVRKRRRGRKERRMTVLR